MEADQNARGSAVTCDDDLLGFRQPKISAEVVFHFGQRDFPHEGTPDLLNHACASVFSTMARTCTSLPETS
jgi:hypothetical protein